MPECQKDGSKGLRIRAGLVVHTWMGAAEISDTSEPPSHTCHYTSHWFKTMDEGVLRPSDVNENNSNLLRLVLSAQRLIRELGCPQTITQPCTLVASYARTIVLCIPLSK